MTQRIAVVFEALGYGLERTDSTEEFLAVRKDSTALFGCEDRYCVGVASMEGFGSCRSKFETLMYSDVRLREMKEKMEISVEVFRALKLAEESFEVAVYLADVSMGRIA
jgi:hypothetical protein